MAYTKNTNFTAKDALASGNPSKIIKGTELDVEFTEIATESAKAVEKAANNTLSGDNTLSGNNMFSGDNTYTGINDFTGATIAGASPFVFEGATADGFETTIAVTDPTADRTQTLPDKAGTFAMLDDADPIQSITGTVAASALTCGLAAGSLNFRSSTLTDGASTSVSHDALSLVVPSGATLGTVSAVQSRLILLAINNVGTAELAIVNQSGGNNLDETTLISTTAIDATADSKDVIYSTTARTNVPFRVVGYIESTQTTAGTWAQNPTTLQGAGGNALATMSSLGYGQTLQVVTGSRAIGTTYYNTTGKPIEVRILCVVATGNTFATYTVDGTGLSFYQAYSAGAYGSCSFIVPPGSNYSLTGASSIDTWHELR